MALLISGWAVPPQALHAQTAARQQAGPQQSKKSRKAVETLRRDLEAVFAAPIMAQATWAVVVRSLSTGEILYERNADKLMVPASNMKIVTLAAAARVLGWDAHFTTTLESDAAIEAGTLRGDLYVRGGGDPTINTRNGRGAAVFADWAAALLAAGIQRIDGRIIGDDNLFDDEGIGAGWAWDYLEADYAAPVGALQYDEDVAALTVLPGRTAGDPAMVTLAPHSGLSVVNKATTSPAGTPETIQVRRRLDAPILEVTGTVPMPPAEPLPAGQVTRAVGRFVAVVNPTAYFVQSLKDALIAKGIAVTGDAVDIDDLAPALTAGIQRRELASSESQPLRDIAAVMMKVSQNLYAETLLKATGAAGGSGTVQAGRAAVLDTLRDWKLDGQSLVMLDGSGLSRYDYVTARLISSILDRLYSDPRHRDAFAATLAVAGRDGTIANRLKRTRAEANARVKTGSISNMRALSGYVNTRDGEPLAFSIIANDFTLPAATVNWIMDLAVEIMANVTRQ